MSPREFMYWQVFDSVEHKERERAAEAARIRGRRGMG